MCQKNNFEANFVIFFMCQQRNVQGWVKQGQAEQLVQEKSIIKIDHKQRCVMTFK